jgi:protoheme IX farnesyltransferase
MMSVAPVAPLQAGASSVRSLAELTKPRITLLSVATAAVGLELAPGRASLGVVMVVLFGTALIVGSANTLNMYLERDVDAKMSRTRRRPLPSGRLRPKLALRFGVLQGLVGLPILGLGANALTGLLGAVALFTYVVIYTPLKRRSFLALFVGAIPGAMPPLLGWVAGTGALEAAGLALFGVVFFWQIPHFLAIALYRGADYRAAGLKVLPNELGAPITRWIVVVGLVLQLFMTLALVPLGLGGGVYLVGALVLGAILLVWGVIGLVRRGDDTWARRLFVLSVAFLPLLFALLIASPKRGTNPAGPSGPDAVMRHVLGFGL